MKYLKSDSESVRKTAEALKSNKIVIIPTDTVYGFSGIVNSCPQDRAGSARDSDCCGNSDAAVGANGGASCCDSGTDAEIRRIKGREAYKPFIQLIAAPEDIKLITDDPIPDELFSLWPGALTIIVNDKRAGAAFGAGEASRVGEAVDSAGSGSASDCAEKPKTTVAVRCPGDAWLREVIRETGAPIYSTSVNRSGKPVLSDIADIVAEFGKEVELIIDDGDKRNALPSTIVSVANGKCTVLRQGSVIIP